MKALLVGGNGFIGSHVTDVLLERGHEVRVLDPVPERHRPPLPSVDYRPGSSTDPAALGEALAEADGVVYLASNTVPATSNTNAAWDISSNLVPLVATLDAMVHARVRRIVYFSSGGTTYGIADRELVTEDHPLRPVCSYGIVKVAAEKYLGMYEYLHGIQTLALRPSNPVGPRQGHEGVQGFVGTALLRVLRGDTLQVWGDGSVVRDYIYVRDLALAAVLALESDATGSINIGSGVGTSLIEVLSLIEHVTGAPLDVQFRPGRDFDVPRLVLAVERAWAVLGWKPTTTLQASIYAHWHWLLGS